MYENKDKLIKFEFYKKWGIYMNNNIYPMELLKQEINMVEHICSSKGGLMIQLGGWDFFNRSYYSFFEMKRKHIVSDAEGVEVIELFDSYDGRKKFRYLVSYLYVIQKKGITPAFLDMVFGEKNYKEEINRLYGWSYTIWEEHENMHVLGIKGVGEPPERKSNDVYILEVLQGIEKCMYTRNKLVSKFSDDYMQSVIEQEYQHR